MRAPPPSPKRPLADHDVPALQTSSQLLCFFIFYLIQLPLLWIHISKLRYLFLAKVIIMPIFGITCVTSPFDPNLCLKPDSLLSLPVAPSQPFRLVGQGGWRLRTRLV